MFQDELNNGTCSIERSDLGPHTHEAHHSMYNANHKELYADRTIGCGLIKSNNRIKLLLLCLLLVLSDSDTASAQQAELQCDESKCRDLYFLGGYGCWARTQNASDAYTCADDYEGQAILTVPTVNHSEAIYQYYTCCPQGYSGPLDQECTDTTCSTPGLVGFDCWADGPFEPMTCAGDVFKYPRKTGYTFPFYAWSYSQFICCKTNDGTPPFQRRLVIAESVALAIGSLGLCTCLIFILGMISSRKARSQAFNLYLIFLSIPDALLDLGNVLWASNTLSGAHFPCHWRNAFLFFYAMANVMLNSVILRQVYILLRDSNKRRRFVPPRTQLVYKQAMVVFFCAILFGIWGATSACGMVFPYDRANTQKIINVLTWTLMAAIPLAHFIFTCVRVWRRRLLPKSDGRTRTMALYLLRVLVSFVLFFLPCMIIVNLEWVGHNPRLHMNYLVRYLSSLQGIVSVAIALTKPDVRRAVKNFLVCRCMVEEADGSDDSKEMRTLMFRRLSSIFNSFSTKASTTMQGVAFDDDEEDNENPKARCEWVAEDEFEKSSKTVGFDGSDRRLSSVQFAEHVVGPLDHPISDSKLGLDDSNRRLSSVTFSEPTWLAPSDHPINV